MVKVPADDPDNLADFLNEERAQEVARTALFVLLGIHVPRPVRPRPEEYPILDQPRAFIPEHPAHRRGEHVKTLTPFIDGKIRANDQKTIDVPVESLSPRARELYEKFRPLTESERDAFAKEQETKEQRQEEQAARYRQMIAIRSLSFGYKWGLMTGELVPQKRRRRSW